MTVKLYMDYMCSFFRSIHKSTIENDLFKDAQCAVLSIDPRDNRKGRKDPGSKLFSRLSQLGCQDFHRLSVITKEHTMKDCKR